VFEVQGFKRHEAPHRAEPAGFVRCAK
jgi:hypothetical protein